MQDKAVLLQLALLTALAIVSPVCSQSQGQSQGQDHSYQYQFPEYTSSIPRELIPIICLFFAVFVIVVCVISFAVFCLSDKYCPSWLGHEDETELIEHISSENSISETSPKSTLQEDSQKDDPPRKNNTGSTKNSVSQDLSEMVMHDDSFSVIINMEPYDSKLRESAKFLLQREVTEEQLRLIDDKEVISLGSAPSPHVKQTILSLPHQQDHQRLKRGRDLNSSRATAYIRG